ncbi:MAG: 50S ribosomal protein L15 [Candidatus Moranbacteria bacterium]|jgi:large subunit ribosomal protein L15|nr:50S ribosomal protein L15 [Candidatus Moranbacteria bacterium]
MQIHQIGNNKKLRKRIGRGGKKGTYSGRGIKGQGSRSGYSRRSTFEGGRTTLVALTKKLKGFKRLVKNDKKIINLQKIDKKFTVGETVNLESLRTKGLIGKNDKEVKILSDGELTKKVNFSNMAVSKAAEEKIKKMGGEIKNIHQEVRLEEKKK